MTDILILEIEIMFYRIAKLIKEPFSNRVQGTTAHKLPFKINELVRHLGGSVS